MTDPRNILICSCEDTMPLDAGAVRRGCRGATVTTARQLCRAELDNSARLPPERARRSSVGCTQEAPLFAEVPPSESGADISFVNIRETAGWSADAAEAGPKMAALLAAAAEPVPDISFVSFTSEGVVLDLRPRRAGDRSRQPAQGSSRRHRADHAAGRCRAAARHRFSGGARARSASAKGHLGAFELTVDDYALPAPSSRGALAFAPSRNGAVSRCDIVLDLSGGAPLFHRADLRDGYLRADPGRSRRRAARRAQGARPRRHLRQAALHRPSPTTFARIRARSIVGCHRCLDLCPTGAIAPAGDHVAIDRAYLRRLRPMRGRLPDRRRLLCAAAC